MYFSGFLEFFCKVHSYGYASCKRGHKIGARVTFPSLLFSAITCALFWNFLRVVQYTKSESIRLCDLTNRLNKSQCENEGGFEMTRFQFKATRHTGSRFAGHLEKNCKLVNRAGSKMLLVRLDSIDSRRFVCLDVEPSYRKSICATLREKLQVC